MFFLLSPYKTSTWPWCRVAEWRGWAEQRGDKRCLGPSESKEALGPGDYLAVIPGAPPGGAIGLVAELENP